jgi:hypothetical protein
MTSFRPVININLMRELPPTTTISFMQINSQLLQVHRMYEFHRALSSLVAVNYTSLLYILVVMPSCGHLILRIFYAVKKL